VAAERFLVTCERGVELWDATSRRPVQRLSLALPPWPEAFGAADQRRLLWFARPGEAELTVVRIADGRFRVIALPAAPRSVIGHPRSSWLFAQLEDSAHLIDLATGADAAMPIGRVAAAAILPRGDGAVMAMFDVAGELTLWEVGDDAAASTSSALPLDPGVTVPPSRARAPSDQASTNGGLATSVRSMLEAAIRGGAVPHRGVPWLGWTVVSMFRYRERQRWACRQLGDRLIERDQNLDEEIVAAPGWRFKTYGRYARFRCATTGEEIDLSVDSGAYDGPGRLTPDAIDPHRFATWIESLAVGAGPGARDRAWAAMEYPEDFTPCELPASHLPESRTWRWIPSRGFLSNLLLLFGQTGVLERDRPYAHHRVATAFEDLATSIVAEDYANPAVAARWASHVGDPEVAGARTSLDTTETVAAHKEWVQRLMRIRWTGKETLLPMLAKHLEPAELVWACDALLEGEGCSAERVLQFLIDRPRLPASQAVARLLATLPVDGDGVTAAKLAIEYLRDRQLGLGSRPRSSSRSWRLPKRRPIDTAWRSATTFSSRWTPFPITRWPWCAAPFATRASGPFRM